MTPWTVAHQAPLFLEFSRQEYRSGLPCPSPVDLRNPGIEPRSCALQADSLPSEPPGKPSNILQFSSVAQSCLTLGDPVKYSTPGLPVHCQLTEFTQTHVHCVGDTIQPSHPSCCPLPLLPSFFPSIRVFSNESVLLIRWPKYWSFSFSTSPANEWLGLISFRMDWLDLLAVQGTLKSLLQHHSSKASIIQC